MYNDDEMIPVAEVLARMDCMLEFIVGKLEAMPDSLPNLTDEARENIRQPIAEKIADIRADVEKVKSFVRAKSQAPRN